MAVLQVIKYGHSVLRQVAKRYKEYEIDQKFVDDMVETMKKEDGVGLAAPQVGVSKRLVVAGDGKEYYVVINPKIVGRSVRTETEVEGCLSLPGLQGRIQRNMKIIVKGLDRYGEPFEIMATGLLARVFQHEIDHLDGILYIDRTQPGTLNWVRHSDDNDKVELTPATINEIQEVYAKTYHQDQDELVFDRNRVEEYAFV